MSSASPGHDKMDYQEENKKEGETGFSAKLKSHIYILSMCNSTKKRGSKEKKTGSVHM